MLKHVLKAQGFLFKVRVREACKSNIPGVRFGGWERRCSRGVVEQGGGAWVYLEEEKEKIGWGKMRDGRGMSM